MKTRIIILTALIVPFITLGQQPCKELFISEYVDGPNKNKVIEVFNPSDTVVNLTGYSIKIFQNGAPTPLTVPLSGSVNPKETYVVTHPQATPDILAKADMTHVWMNFDGNDAVVLNKGQSTYIDKIGEIGVNPGNNGWTVPPSGSTKANDLRRKYPIDKGETDWNQGKNQWEIHPPDSVGNVKDHENVCKCAFSLASGNSWYVKGNLDYSDYQQDVYVFRLTNKQAYTGQLNQSIVDSITFNNATGLKQNIVHFNLLSSQQDREQIRNQIQNDSLFELEFPAVTKFPAADRTQEKWMFTNDVINIVFHDPDPTQATVQYITNKYNLSVMHEPSPSLPKGNNSWTYAYVVNPTGCKSRNSIDVSREIYSKDSATVKIAEPWMEPVAGLHATNDEYFPDSWHIKNTGQCLGMSPSGNGSADADCDIEEAWNAGYTGAGIKVMVIDKGLFDTNNPDMAGKYFKGWDFVDNDPDVSSSSVTCGGIPFPYCLAHPTATSGLIGAIANNNIGAVGVAYDALVVPILSWTASSYLGFQYAVDSVKVDVISCSWGIDGWYSAAIENDINNARTLGRNGKGIPILFAAGNDGNNTNTVFPAYLDTVIGIIASEQNDSKAGFSNYGQKMDVAAPGTHYITTDLSGSAGYNPSQTNLTYNNCSNADLNNNYSYFSGTSGATPIAAGICALILQADTNLTATQVQDILQNTPDKVGGYDYNAVSPGRSKEMGYGRINAHSAVLQAIGIAENRFNNPITVQVYPNPVSGDAILRLSLKRACEISIVLCDYMGSMVKVIIENQHTKTELIQNIPIETTGLSSGVYFVLVKTDFGTHTTKITVIK